MTCKECIHYDICLIRDELSDDESKVVSVLECERFKDRSHFVELPCKVGDTIYVVEKGKIIQDSVVTLYVAYFGGDEETFQFDGIKTNGYFSDFGKTVFLNREEAEQVLKERESSD